tara:strand:+ start:364 stop:600 length:237 start_codon:yes stop_codon:yes gene_type:complete
MNFLKKYYILCILLSTTFFVQFIIANKNNQLKKLEEEEFKKQSDKIENCIDFENKNKRTIYENIKLSEYCIYKFGAIK